MHAACIHANLFMRSHIKQGVKMCIKIKLEAISYFLDDLPQIHHWWDYSLFSFNSDPPFSAVLMSVKIIMKILH